MERAKPKRTVDNVEEMADFARQLERVRNLTQG
jgi:hypothetical protein